MENIFNEEEFFFSLGSFNWVKRKLDFIELKIENQANKELDKVNRETEKLMEHIFHANSYDSVRENLN